VDFKTGTQTEEKQKKYQIQLDFYEEVLKDMSMNVVDKQLLWI